MRHLILSLILLSSPAWGNELEAYFEHETTKLEERCLAEIRSAEDWLARRDVYREQLQEMLGLAPWPERTDLQATVTKTVRHEEFTVENLHFQSLPGLYVTGNLYLPRGATEGPHPAVLYVCGHARVVEDGVNFGNKARYQHHPAWFARHGYVCLTIDTIQLGEIEGIHHGTYREGMWWWNNRGYTPAGAEAWNGIRALDYLQSRSEVDGTRIGITGRSGGGIYSWWVGALDDRVKVAVPVAGITSLRNHVVDGCVEGHCDCMYHINTFRWDFPQIAALMAPRPLLISNSDKDTIFPLDGVVAVHGKVKRIYELLEAEDQLGLQITEGAHRDSQELRVHAFRWFNRFLKGEDALIRRPAEALLPARDLKVFDELPEDERTSVIHETFVPRAPAPVVPTDAVEWEEMRSAWMRHLESKVFAGWPEAGETSPLPALVRLEPIEGENEERVRLLTLVDEATWARDPERAHQLRRRFMLLGQTLDGMRVWDLLRQLMQREEPLTIHAEGRAAGIALYASLFDSEKRLRGLELTGLPTSHRNGPIFLNVSRFLDLPQALAMAGEQCPVRLKGLSREDRPQLRFAEETLNMLGLEGRLMIH